MSRNHKKRNSTPAPAPKPWVRLGEGIVLAEATALVIELEAQGIQSWIRSRDEDSPPDQAVHQVMVETRRKEEAEMIRLALVEEHAAALKETPEDNRWTRAGLAGVLGFLLGARLGSRLKGSRGAVLVPFIVAMACFACAYLWPDAHGN